MVACNYDDEDDEEVRTIHWMDLLLRVVVVGGRRRGVV